MLAAHTDSVDRALWAALRALEDRAALTRKLAEHGRARQHHWVARAFGERAKAAADHAKVVRDLLGQRTSSHIVPDHSDELDAPKPVVVLPETEDEGLSVTRAG